MTYNTLSVKLKSFILSLNKEILLLIIILTFAELEKFGRDKQVYAV